MSQYLTITLKHRTKDVEIDLVSYTTTPARELSNESIFNYTEKPKTLLSSNLNYKIERIKEALDEEERQMYNLKEEREELKSMVSRCESKDTTNVLLERLDGNLECIRGTQEDIDFFKGVLQKMEVVMEIYGENVEDWELYYTNC